MAEENWVVHRLGSPEGQLDHAIFCPACRCGHGFKVKSPGPVWTFNGDMIKPTVSPSVRVEHYSRRHDRMVNCHFFITNGQIIFCSDCTHDFAGQTVALEPF